MGKFWRGKKLRNLANHELFAKTFLTNIHRYTENVFGICTDCSLFAKFFLANIHRYTEMCLAYVQTVAYLLNFSSPIRSFYLYDLPKIFPATIFLCTEIRFQTQGSMEFIIRSSWAVGTTNSLRVKVL